MICEKEASGSGTKAGTVEIQSTQLADSRL